MGGPLQKYVSKVSTLVLDLHQKDVHSCHFSYLNHGTDFLGHAAMLHVHALSPASIEICQSLGDGQKITPRLPQIFTASGWGQLRASPEKNSCPGIRTCWGCAYIAWRKQIKTDASSLPATQSTGIVTVCMSIMGLGQKMRLIYFLL